MSIFGKESSETQTVGPPEFAVPFVEAGFGQAQELYNQGGPQYYPNQTYVPFSQQSEQAMGATADRAMQGSPLTGAAQNYATQSLNGDFLNSNPWLDQTFDRAVQKTRGALDSQFATAGRDLQAQLPYRSEQVNDLARNIYGGAYESERNRQQGVLPFANSLANQDYVDLAALQGVGSQVEGKAGEVLQSNMDRWNFNQQRPEQALDSYLSRIALNTGSAGQEQTSPIYRNPAAGALGGAATGAWLGQQMGSDNPLWMWGGGLLGGLGG